MKEKNIVIETPEKIRFTYEVAEIGTRAAAFVIDFLIQGVVYILAVILIFSISGNTGENAASNDFYYIAVAFTYIVIFFLQWGYFILFELVLLGRSPGKKLMRIRVIKDNGEPLDAGAVILRNLIRGVDFFPMFNLLGGIITILDKRSRRLGDIVSNTLVVKEMQFKLQEPDFKTIFSQSFGKGTGLLAPGKRLSENELYIIRRFLNAKNNLRPEKQQSVARELADKIKERLQISKEVTKPIIFLEEIYKAHTHEDQK